MKRTKRKIIILASIISLLAVSSIVFAAFVFTRIINGTAYTGDVYDVNNKILNYGYYAGLEDDSTIDISTDEKKAQVLANLSSRTNDNPTEINSNTIECYATKRTGYDDEYGEYHLPYLNQLGFKFKFKTSIDVYVRIHFEDAWISKKTYRNGKTEQSYIVKDQLNGVYEKMNDALVNEENFAAYYVLKQYIPSTFSTSKVYYTYNGVDTYTYASINEEEFNTQKAKPVDDSTKIIYYELTPSKLGKYSDNATYYKFSSESPFAITAEGWYYDASTNIAYKKQKIDVDEQTGAPQNFEFQFDLDENYYYKEHNGSYHESVKIKLSYFVDFVQANRVYALWKLNPETLI